jgi:hypothetical protein
MKACNISNYTLFDSLKLEVLEIFSKSLASFLMLLFIPNFLLNATPMTDNEAKIFYDDCENNILESMSRSGKEGLPSLVNDLQYFGRKISIHHNDARLVECYLLAQSGVLTIPGHAKFVADEYEELVRNTYSDGRERYWYIVERLKHMPSPETIVVLGNYLDDFKETAAPDLDVELQRITLPVSSEDCLGTSHLPWLATYSLSEIGLREPPLGDAKLDSYSFHSNCTEWWKQTRQWYQEIKVGKRTFSFRGQPVEYRFNADGTWKTIVLKNPPDDAIKYPIMTREEFERRNPTPETESNVNQSIIEPPHTFWKWLFGIIPLVLVTMWWRISKRRVVSSK